MRGKRIVKKVGCPNTFVSRSLLLIIIVVVFVELLKAVLGWLSSIGALTVFFIGGGGGSPFRIPEMGAGPPLSDTESSVSDDSSPLLISSSLSSSSSERYGL